MTTALVLVDLQNDYFVDDELARCRDDLVGHADELVRRARAAGALVVEVRTVHARDRSTWALNMLEDGQGMAIEGTDGAEPLEGLPAADEVVVKTRDSAFHRTGLHDLLRARGVDRLVLAGVSTESCVVANAYAYAYDLRVVLVRDATASVDEQLHEQSLARLHEQYRQEVRWTADVRFEE